VSVIVPTRNRVELLQTVVDGLLNHTDYPEFEVLVVDNDSDCPATLEYLESLLAIEHSLDHDLSFHAPAKPRIHVRVLRYPHPFNYAAINNFAAREARGELLLLLNNDVEITDPRWMTEMVVQFTRDGADKPVAAVGKKLLWANGMVQHGGVVVGINGLAAHAFNHCQANDPGYMGLNLFDREQSAVTAACLMIRKSDYWAVGGLDAHQLPVAFNDVDLCLKLRELGKRIVLTTRFPLIHHESATRGQEDTPQKLARAKRERDYFMRRWMPVDHAWTDPYYHPGLNHDFVSGPYGGLGRLADDTGLSAQAKGSKP
jgi:GT2 family glycosyltransferase